MLPVNICERSLLGVTYGRLTNLLLAIEQVENALARSIRRGVR